MLGVLLRDDKMLKLMMEDEDQLQKIWQSAIERRPSSAHTNIAKQVSRWSLLRNIQKDRHDYEKPWRHASAQERNRKVSFLTPEEMIQRELALLSKENTQK